MLQTIRDHTQGWLAGIIVSVLILMFALWGISAYFTGGSGNTIVAKVNGAEITKERFTLAYEQARKQLQTELGSSSSLTPKQEAGLKDRVLQDLIATEVLKQASLAENYRISSYQIDNYLENIPEFQENGQFSMSRFQEVMAASLYTASDLLDLIKTTLLIAQPKLGVVLTSFGLPNEVNYTIALVSQERDLNYLSLSLTTLGDFHKPAVTSEEIATYYKAHEDEFKTPEQLSVDFLELSLKDVMSAIHPTPEMLKNYYNENINNYTQPAQWQLISLVFPLTAGATKEEVTAAEAKAKDVFQKIRKGESFEKFTHQHSDSSLQAELEGWVSLSQLSAPYQKALMGLTKEHPLSEPIQTDKGFVILKMTGKKETQVESFAQVEGKVKEMVVRQHAEEKMATLRDQLSDLTYEHPDSLQMASKTLNLPIKSTGLFTRDKGGQDISANKKVRDAAFTNDVVSLQNNSDVIQMTPEMAIVLRVKSHLPPTLLSLDSVSKQIQDRLEAEKTKSQLSRIATEIYDKLQAGISEEQLAQHYHLQWNTVGFIGRYSNKVPTAILDRAFQLPRPQKTTGKNSYGIVQLPEGFAVIALRAVREGGAKDKKQYALFAEQVQNSEGLLEYELYKQGLLQKAKISIENP